jgi:VanZ family protein
MAAIFVVSSLPNPQIGGETPDYILHGLEYFLLTLLLIRLFLVKQSSLDEKISQDFRSWQYACLLGVIIAVGYGVTDEIHQYFVPGRHCSLHDVLSDTVGAMLAYGVATLDYLFLNHYSPLITTSLKRFRMIRSMSYAAYRFK